METRYYGWKIAALVVLALLLIGSGVVAGVVWGGSRGPWRGGLWDHPFLGNEGRMHPFEGRYGEQDSWRNRWPGGVPQGDRDNSAALVTTLQEAAERVEAAMKDRRGERLVVDEVMQFDNHFYVQVIEADTGVHAMELLVDPQSGRVSLEPGPNHMWNTKYGMMGRGNGGMMGAWRGSDEGGMQVTPAEARTLAQAELQRIAPGLEVAAEVDAFYGYYTMHTLRQGEVEGMLSVHGSSGEVWLHTWHGDFIAMSEHAHD